MLEGAGHGRDPAESGLIDLASYVAVVVLDVLGATQTPEHCPERQRAMCDSILFNGKGDLEEWLPFVALQGSKSFPEPSRWEEHTSELQSLMRISYAAFCLTKKKDNTHPLYRRKQL